MILVGKEISVGSTLLYTSAAIEYSLKLDTRDQVQKLHTQVFFNQIFIERACSGIPLFQSCCLYHLVGKSVLNCLAFNIFHTVNKRVETKFYYFTNVSILLNSPYLLWDNYKFHSIFSILLLWEQIGSIAF